MSSYNYIISGMGAAGLSLAVHMIHSGKFHDKKILLVDKDDKNKNDRTWCFWEKQEGLFESIIYRKWSKARFYGEDFSRSLALEPYEYKLIRGIDFYNYAIGLVEQSTNFIIRKGEVQKIVNNTEGASVTIDGETISAEWVFNSILFDKPVLTGNEYLLLQHFKGWVIQTEQPVFNSEEPVLMDFRIAQDLGTTFIYIMPFTEKKALIEYTLFSEKILPGDEYEKGLRSYINKSLNVDSFTILEEEFGIIPMTNHKFRSRDGHIINIGTAGGQTKASSGYTFRFIQKHSAALTDALIRSGKPLITGFGVKRKFRFYDSVLLDILYNKKLSGQEIFSSLFRRNDPAKLLKFLDNESSLREDLKIISSLPTMPFLKAAINQLLS